MWASIVGTDCFDAGSLSKPLTFIFYMIEQKGVFSVGEFYFGHWFEFEPGFLYETGCLTAYGHNEAVRFYRRVLGRVIRMVFLSVRTVTNAVGIGSYTHYRFEITVLRSLCIGRIALEYTYNLHYSCSLIENQKKTYPTEVRTY